MNNLFFWFVVIAHLIAIEIIGIYFLVMFFNLCANVKELREAL